MPLLISPVQNGQLATLERLLLLYAHDLSEFDSQEPETDGSYKTAQWLAGDAGVCRMIMTLRDKPAGLVFVRQQGDTKLVSDLFVLRCYRGLGLGEEAVLRIVAQTPGRWSARVDSDNVGGLAFWRHVLRRHAGRNYRETLSTCGSARLFEFESNGSAIVRS
jgi:predicted acetyltransferase